MATAAPSSEDTEKRFFWITFATAVFFITLVVVFLR